MPGLPMFGHGQVEGFTEKYGMEYRRAYRDEPCDEAFMERHEREIFPLMRKRYLFSDARNFALFDFTTAEGWVDENVFAYSNRYDGEHALIVYNNAYTTTHGVVHTSTAINVGKGDSRVLERRRLSEALALDTDPRAYVVWRDARTGLEYLHHCSTLAENGLSLELHAYEYRSFIFLRHIHDTDTSWGRLHGKLGGQGVPSIQEAYLEMHLSGILEPFRDFMKPDMIRYLLLNQDGAVTLGPWRTRFAGFLDGLSAFRGDRKEVDGIADDVEEDLRFLRKIMRTRAGLKLAEPVRSYLKETLPHSKSAPEEVIAFWRVILVYCLMRSLALPDEEKAKVSAGESNMNQDIPPPENGEASVSRMMREWLLIKPIAHAFEALDGNTWQAWQDARLVSLCLAHRTDLLSLESEIWGPILYRLFENDEMREVLMTHWYDGRRWVNKEQLERALLVLFLSNCIALNTKKKTDTEQVTACLANIQEILLAAADTGYDINWTLSVLK